MSRGARRAMTGAAVVALAVALLAGAAVLTGGSDKTAAGPTSATVADTSGKPAKGIEGMQAHLASVPGDWPAWAGLGAAYVERARLTGDATLYPKADDALAKSLQVHPTDNAPAVTAQAILAAARHNFTQALTLADKAQQIDSYNSLVYGVKGDALDELGRYDEAEQAFQKMVDLKPGFSAYTRISYLRELHGMADGARAAMQQGYDEAFTPADKAFAAYYLGELAWNNGDVDTAGRWYDDGLAKDPAYLPPLYGKARVESARGQTDKALADYATLVDRLPLPLYAIEYGELLQSLGRTDEAQQQYAVVDAETKLLKANGVAVDQEIALYDADHGRAKQALAEAQAATTYRGGVFTEDALAWALHVNGRDQEALAHADKANAMGTHNALFPYHRGMIKSALGDVAGARADLTAALALNPNFSYLQAPIARAELAKLGGKA